MPSINPTDAPSITGSSYFGSYFPSTSLDSIRKSAVSNGSWALDCAAEPFREMGKLIPAIHAPARIFESGRIKDLVQDQAVHFITPKTSNLLMYTFEQLLFGYGYLTELLVGSV